MTSPLNTRRQPPYKLAGLILTLLTIAVVVLVYFQFRGDFLDRDKLTMMSARAGWSMDPGAKVTYNGAEIGRRGKVEEGKVAEQNRAKTPLEGERTNFNRIPKNARPPHTR